MYRSLFSDGFDAVWEPRMFLVSAGFNIHDTRLNYVILAIEFLPTLRAASINLVFMSSTFSLWCCMFVFSV